MFLSLFLTLACLVCTVQIKVVSLTRLKVSAKAPRCGSGPRRRRTGQKADILHIIHFQQEPYPGRQPWQTVAHHGLGHGGRVGVIMPISTRLAGECKLAPGRRGGAAPLARRHRRCRWRPYVTGQMPSSITGDHSDRHGDRPDIPASDSDSDSDAAMAAASEQSRCGQLEPQAECGPLPWH